MAKNRREKVWSWICNALAVQGLVGVLRSVGVTSTVTGVLLAFWDWFGAQVFGIQVLLGTGVFLSVLSSVGFGTKQIQQQRTKKRERLPETSISPRPDTEGWKGVEVQGRYFAWDGPGFYALPDRPPIPAPLIAINAIRDLGATPSFGSQNKLRDHLARGSMQVYETDRATWRRELLHDRDGSQVLLVSERPHD